MEEPEQEMTKIKSKKHKLRAEIHSFVIEEIQRGVVIETETPYVWAERFKAPITEVQIAIAFAEDFMLWKKSMEDFAKYQRCKDIPPERKERLLLALGKRHIRRLQRMTEHPYVLQSILEYLPEE